MRSRNIKPGFFTNEDLAEVSIAARYLFSGLWCLADREGRLEDRPKRIKGEIFRFDSIEVDHLLEELFAFHFIDRYEVGGKRFIWIPKFTSHQSPHYTEKPSIIPPSPQEKSSLDNNTTPGKSFHDEYTTPGKSFDSEKEIRDYSGTTPGQEQEKPLIKKGSLPPDSLIPDSLIPDSKHLPKSRKKSAMGDGEYPEDFLEFWKSYPRKIAKKDAYKAWKKQNPPLEDCLKTLEWQIKSDDWTKEKGQYIPHPATWINDGRWQDEIPVPPAKRKTSYLAY